MPGMRSDLVSLPLCSQDSKGSHMPPRPLHLPQSELPDWNLALGQVSEPSWHRGAQRSSSTSRCREEMQTTRRGLSHDYYSYFPMLGFHGTQGSHPGTGITPPPLHMGHNLLSLPLGQIRCFCLSDPCRMFTTCSGYFQGGCQPTPKMCR